MWIPENEAPPLCTYQQKTSQNKLIWSEESQILTDHIRPAQSKNHRPGTSCHGLPESEEVWTALNVFKSAVSRKIREKSSSQDSFNPSPSSSSDFMYLQWAGTPLLKLYMLVLVCAFFCSQTYSGFLPSSPAQHSPADRPCCRLLAVTVWSDRMSDPARYDLFYTFALHFKMRNTPESSHYISKVGGAKSSCYCLGRALALTDAVWLFNWSFIVIKGVNCCLWETFNDRKETTWANSTCVQLSRCS